MTPSQPFTNTYLALGDSYTIGESVAASDRWSVQMAGLLRREGVSVADPEIIARTGWTTDELQAGIRQSGVRGPFGVVSLLIGVNNQFRGQSPEKYRTEFRELLQTATQFADEKPGRVFVLSIPDWGVSPYARTFDRGKIAREIDTFNAVAKEECGKAGVAFIDITPLSRQAAGDPSQIAEDGLHFSGKQYRLWAEKALPVVKKMF
ncbi:SGNH/GDSL hydrolase family protein [Larkinella soli]|uniref:SGNH/GDSL hydrolase family protein n=1 Tax=Larkinella soli TaxID=1770527 RepID=UPI000FFB519A|nr:SGNH/GDSL hydrolase family protein [Larkinella soli]